MADELRERLQTALGSAYSIERELGGGGMSRVFIAEETAFGRKVVVKVVPPDVAAGVNVDRFKREIQVAAKLQHPHIVPVLSSGEMNGLPYYTMPFVEGESLRARLIRAGALSITDAVNILRDLARALLYAHEHSVVHRDIKPDNVLLSLGSATVADFGIAKAISAARGDIPGATLTQIGTSLGTPAYMAPEQAAADPASNHRADIYAFGCVAYEVLTGRPPFIEKTPQRLLAAHMGEKPAPVTDLRADTPPALAELVMKCLEKDADSRPQSAGELVKVLETVTSGGGHAALPAILVGGPGMFRKALASYAAAFVLMLLVTQAAIIAIGLPDWVLPGATIVMLMGLPVILFTGYVQRVTRRAVTTTPTYTPGGTPSMQHGTMATIAMKASPHVSWSRTAKGGMIAFSAFIVLVGVFMLMRVLGIGPAGSLLASGRLQSRQPLLLTEFRVVQSDSTLGAVISQAVRSNLEQSSAISVVSMASVAAALQRMQRPASTKLDLTLAQQLAAREGIKAIIDGEVAGIGSGFLLTLRLVTADSARELAVYREAADGPKQLIDAVDVVSRKLRARIGESLKAVRASPPLAHVTTASLDALRKYTEATRATGNSDWTSAAALAREAIALDTGFALAYRHLSESLVNGGLRGPASDSAITRAFQMRDRLTERERLAVIGDYYSIGPGLDRAKAVEAFERQIAMGEYSNTNSVGIILASRREYARAESLAKIRIRAEPDYALSYSNLALFQMYQGKLTAAESTIRVAEERFPAYVLMPIARARLAFQRDSNTRAIAILDSVQQQTTAGSERPVSQPASGFLAYLAEVRGRMRERDGLLRQWRAADSARGVRPQRAADTVAAVRRDAWFFGASTAHARRLEAALTGTSTTLAIAEAFAFIGRPDRARAVLSAYEAALTDTVQRRVQQPAAHNVMGEIALADGRPIEAMAHFRRGDTLPDGPANGCDACLHGRLARAFDRADMADSAIYAIEQFLTHARRSRVLPEPFLEAPFEKRLGELYEQRGDRQRAYAHYAKFVSLWQTADPELQPKVAEVRRRMARLRDTERR